MVHEALLIGARYGGYAGEGLLDVRELSYGRLQVQSPKDRVNWPCVIIFLELEKQALKIGGHVLLAPQERVFPVDSCVKYDWK
eukprot:scaffold7044_cov216-Pinguiococcus_pyrenoidosus.AAC.12